MGEYDTDVVLWSEHQTALLRRRAAGELINEADLDRRPMMAPRSD